MSEPRAGDRAPQRQEPLWTASQRRVLIALVIGLLIYLSIRFWRNPHYVSDPQQQHPPRMADLQDRIDPNTADWPTLAALPTIGEKRAKEIVAYRERRQVEAPGRIVFRRLEDLMLIRGIGPATISNLAPYLIFPATTQPATRQASTRYNETGQARE